MSNYFLRDVSFYKRNIDPIEHYISQTSLYLSKNTGYDIDYCRDWIKKTLNKLPTNDPIISYFERNDFNDRHKTNAKLSNYIYDAIKDDRIIAPTFTTYVNPKKKKSLLVGFIDRNVKIRSQAKKEAFKAKVNNNIIQYIQKNNEQKNMKIYNNSLSGAFASNGSILNNPTAHSTLTSTTRSVSSFGNAINERIVMGNRHYYNPFIVINAILNCCYCVNKEEVTETIRYYNLNVPSVDDVMRCITYSSNLYWTDSRQLNIIRDLVSKLDDAERSAFVYSSDLYWLRTFNDEFMRVFISRLSTKVNKPISNSIEVLKNIDEAVLNLTHSICYEEVKGLGKNYDTIPNVHIVAATALNVLEVLEQYKLLIKTFFLSNILPESHAYIPRMIRRSVVLSDTDSTCFSVDDWIKWYFGRIVFNEYTDAVAGSVAFITTQSISHVLALFSANINVTTDKLHSLAMKNEYLWHVHIPTNVSKHYAALTVMQEGNVFKEPELEIKGVHLKNSASPTMLIKEAHEMIKDILMTVKNNDKISIYKYLRQIYNTEQKIQESILNNKTDYFKQSKIKEPSAYAKEEHESPYQHYYFWKNSFASKYGDIEPPPFNVIKIPTILSSSTKLKNWLIQMKDQKLASLINNWLVEHKKDSLNTLYISYDYARAYGIPEEIKCIININKIILDLTITHRLILESLGVFLKHNWTITDYNIFKPEDQHG